ncbi:hypothetical protein ABT093_36070 [Kitasatospora sp. NPDC002551]|uniref:hypothetical protein n=1 Tax=Kitasatospora sp. NPDC002551 TaxID=3154539 RepID=UPI0033324C4B
MSSSDLSLQDLVSAAVEDTVATASPAAGLWLVAELELRGPEATWGGVQLLFAPLAARPAYGLSPHEAADRLRHNARTAQPDVALVLSMRLAHWEKGTEAVARLWHEAPAALRRTAFMHWLICYCLAIGHDGIRLSAEDTAALVRRAIPLPPGAAR